jgi:hypothetical protein
MYGTSFDKMGGKKKGRKKNQIVHFKFHNNLIIGSGNYWNLI